MIQLRQALLGLTMTAMFLTAACASAPRPRAESAPSATSERLPDSRPERVAAQRAAAPASLELEPSDERWGIEAAKERRDAERQKKAASSGPPPTTPLPTASPSP